MIVVLGAGPAGLACAAALRNVGQTAVVLERGEVAAAWSTRYDRLQLHTVRWLSGLPGYRIPRSFGKWPTRDGIIEYLHAYAARHALDVRTGTTVDRIDRAHDGWVVHANGEDLPARRVVVATGYSNAPHVPPWPGAFSGEIVHSSAYRNPAPFRDRRVLVVGAGNSGAEITVDLADGGATAVMLSVRTPPAIIRRDTIGIPSQLLGIASGHLPVGVVDRIAETIRRVAIPDLEAYGLPRPTRPYSDFLRRRMIPILDVGIVDAVRRGRVRVVAALERFDDGRALLADGTAVEVDVVVAATGFRTGLEPLVGHLGVLDGNGVPLVHAAQEHTEAPGLHFVGYEVTLSGMLRHVGRQATELAAALAHEAVPG